MLMLLLAVVVSMTVIMVAVGINVGQHRTNGLRAASVRNRCFPLWPLGVLPGVAVLRSEDGGHAARPQKTPQLRATLQTALGVEDYFQYPAKPNQVLPAALLASCPRVWHSLGSSSIARWRPHGSNRGL